MKQNFIYPLVRCRAVFLAIFFIFQPSCAQTTLDIDKSENYTANATKVVFPPYEGEKMPVAVFPMGLSEKAAQRYPHLLDKSVGLGVDNLLADSLYQTKRYRFVEDKESVIKESLNKLKMSASGLVDEKYALQIGKMLGAKKIIYGEVYDYSEGKVESVKGFKRTTTPKIRVGIQIRLVDTETLEYIPASSVKFGADWGEASQAAVESAVYKLVTN